MTAGSALSQNLNKMTFKERITILVHYRFYCLNRANFDPVGGLEDVGQLFKDLAENDPKLKEMFDEEYNSIFSDDRNE